MISDSKRFLASEFHIAGDDINALFTVTVRELVVILKGINSLPNASLVLYVTKALLINVNLTQIVKERDDSYTFIRILKSEALLYSVRFKIGIKTFINVNRVLTKTALVRAMESGAGRSHEEIRGGRE